MTDLLLCCQPDSAAPDVNDGVIIDDMLVGDDVVPAYNHMYTVEGIGHFSYGNYKIEATNVQDLGAGSITGAEGVYNAPPPAPPPPCLAGHFSGAQGCVICLPGTADTDSDPLTLCEQCSVGSYAAAGATACMPCVAGQQLDDGAFIYK